MNEPEGMDEPEPTRPCERIDDAAAYVLGALAESELDPYRSHLAGCAACREEVLHLQPVVDSLAVGVPVVQAPGGLRARLMAVVHGESELLRAAGRDADRPARAQPRRFWLLPSLASAGALAAGLLIGALAIGNSSGVRTRVIQATVVAPGTHANAALHQTGSRVVLQLVGFPPPPRGRIYEVWLEHGAQPPQPTDVLFSVTLHGNGSVVVPGDLQGVTKVLVTDEPLGGSPHPTRNPVIVAPI
jgi:Anti-sigma-K factor rskA